MKVKNTEVENKKIQYFLDEKKILSKLGPLLEDHIKRSPCLDESIIKNLSRNFSEDQLEMLIQLLEREVKVKEFNRTFFISTLVAIFAILTVIFTLIGSAAAGNPGLVLTAFILTPIIFIVINYSSVSDKSYRKTNKLLVIVNVAKKYKSNPEIL